MTSGLYGSIWGIRNGHRSYNGEGSRGLCIVAGELGRNSMETSTSFEKWHDITSSTGFVTKFWKAEVVPLW